MYRDEAQDTRRLQTFHQAEVMQVGPGLSAWDLMDWYERVLDRMLPGLPIRVGQVRYEMYAGSRRGYEVDIRDGDKWLGIAGFAQCDDAVVATLGLDPAKVRVVSLGLGLERMACLRYGIDDVRTVESRRVDMS